MNLSQFLYSLYWNILGFVSPTAQPEMFSWGIKTHVFLENTKRYPNLRTNLLGFDLKSPIGVASDIGLDEQTVDALIQHGAGFGTMGSYTYRENENHYQSLFYRRKKRTNIIRQEFRRFNLVNSDKKLSQRRHLPHCVGISMTSYMGDDIRISEKEYVPGYLHEYQLMTQKAAPVCDYLVINTSHPATPMYQLLSDESTIIPIIQIVQKTAQIAAPISTPKIILKVPFDVSHIEVKSIAQIALKTGIDAIMISGHAVLTKNAGYIEKRIEMLDDTTMLTGDPLHDGMLQIVKKFRKCTHGMIPLIVSDCALSGRDVFDFMAVGASAVEAGVVFYFNGPSAIHKLNAELSTIMRRKGINKVSDLIGRSAPLDPNVTVEDLLR